MQSPDRNVCSRFSSSIDLYKASATLSMNKLTQKAARVPVLNGWSRLLRQSIGRERSNKEKRIVCVCISLYSFYVYALISSILLSPSYSIRPSPPGPFLADVQTQNTHTHRERKSMNERDSHKRKG